MNAKICDRCGKTFTWHEILQKANNEAWRYDLTKYCHPYPESITLDLCLECKEDLVRWFKGSRKSAE